MSDSTSKVRTNSAPVPSGRPSSSYPPDTADRLGSVAGSIRSAARLLEHQPDEIMDHADGELVDVLHLLQVIEKEVRAINHSAVELQEVAHG